MEPKNRSTIYVLYVGIVFWTQAKCMMQTFKYRSTSSTYFSPSHFSSIFNVYVCMTIFQRIDPNRALVICLLVLSSSPITLVSLSSKYLILMYWNLAYRRISVWRKFHPYTICNKLSCHWLKDVQNVETSVVILFDNVSEKTRSPRLINKYVACNVREHT